MQEIPYGLCHCGCGGQTRIAEKTDRAIGWVKGQPIRYLRGHGAAKAEKWVVDDAGCWVWQLQVGPLGYGRIGRGGKILHAHRWVYEQQVGPIPEGLALHHTCRNKRCVNPDHLELMTNSLHTQLHSQANLTNEQVREIRESGDLLADIAERYGISISYTHALRTGVARRDAGGPIVDTDALRQARRCEQCGEIFEPRRTHQRYCKRSCSSLAFYHRQKGRAA